VAQAQPTRSQELHTLLQVVVERDQTAKAVLVEMVVVSVEMEARRGKRPRVAETQPQIQVQEEVVAAVITDRYMAAPAALELSSLRILPNTLPTSKHQNL
jgi:3-methyladenine DNA glycosylase Mpg